MGHGTSLSQHEPPLDTREGICSAAVRVAFDSRPASDDAGIGRYARCVLESLRLTAPAGAELVETHRPRRVDVFHSPWIDGAPLRPSCPTVVTLHNLVPLKRRGEYLRSGVRFKLRYLAVQRATKVIVPTEVVAADVVEHLRLPRERIAIVPEAAATSLTMRPPDITSNLSPSSRASRISEVR